MPCSWRRGPSPMWPQKPPTNGPPPCCASCCGCCAFEPRAGQRTKPDIEFPPTLAKSYALSNRAPLQNAAKHQTKFLHAALQSTEPSDSSDEETGLQTSQVPPRKSLCAYSKEELLEGDSTRLEVPVGRSQQPTTQDKEKQELKRGQPAGSSNVSQTEGGKLRSKTVVVPASPLALPKEALIRRETTAIGRRIPKMSALSGEASRGTPR